MQSGDTQNVEFSGWSRPHLNQCSGGARQPGSFALVQSERICSKRRRVRDCAAKSRWSGRALTTFDLSLSKSFRMPWYEGHELMFRTEFFNAFNTPQFGQPGATLGTGTFGRVTSTQD